MGIMMLLSAFQYQAPYMGPTYQQAASQAGKAAYIVSGGQAFQDKLGNVASKNATDLVHSVGITDPEMGVVYGGYKIYKSRQIDLKLPRIGPVKFNLTAGQQSGSIGARYEY
jgi:hypothetical protein